MSTLRSRSTSGCAPARSSIARAPLKSPARTAFIARSRSSFAWGTQASWRDVGQRGNRLPAASDGNGGVLDVARSRKISRDDAGDPAREERRGKGGSAPHGEEARVVVRVFGLPCPLVGLRPHHRLPASLERWAGADHGCA